MASDLDARAYHDYKPRAMGAVLASLGALDRGVRLRARRRRRFAAEINLRDRDITNMGFAEAVDCRSSLLPTSTGGVFAHLVGAARTLSPSEQKRVRASSSTVFAATSRCSESGAGLAGSARGQPVLGVLPYLHG